MGGKSSPSPPDYGPLAQASKEAALIAKESADAQLAFAKEMYNENKGLARAVSQSQIDTQAQQRRIADELYQRQQNVFNPVEDRFVNRAMEFDSKAYQERLAAKASADAARALQDVQEADQLTMSTMGINPTSGAFQGQQRANALQGAAMKASARNNARMQSDLIGQSMLADAAGLNRGLVGLSQGSTQLALQAGSNSLANNMAPGQNYLGAMQGANSLKMQGQGQKIQGLSNVLNTQASIYQADQQANGAFWGGLGTLGGLALGGSSKPWFLPG